MNFIKRILSFALAMVIFIVTSGFTVHKHFCGNKLVSNHAYFLQHEKSGCCEHHKEDTASIEVSSKKNVAITVAASGCCKDVTASFKLEDDYSHHFNLNYSFSPSIIYSGSNLIFNFTESSISKDVYYFGNFPPWKTRDPFSLFQIYRL